MSLTTYFLLSSVVRVWNKTQLLLQHLEHPPKGFFPLLSIKEVCYKSVKATLLSYFPFSLNPPVFIGLQLVMKKMPPLGGLGSKIHPLNKITQTWFSIFERYCSVEMTMCKHILSSVCIVDKSQIMSFCKKKGWRENFCACWQCNRHAN